jgi:hypothetical protein
MEALELGGITDVVEPVFADLEAEPGRKLRPQLEILRELGIEERGQPRIFGSGRGDGGLLGSVAGDRRRNRQSGCSPNSNNRPHRHVLDISESRGA